MTIIIAGAIVATGVVVYNRKTTLNSRSGARERKSKEKLRSAVNNLKAYFEDEQRLQNNFSEGIGFELQSLDELRDTLIAIKMHIDTRLYEDSIQLYTTVDYTINRCILKLISEIHQNGKTPSEEDLKQLNLEVRRSRNEIVSAIEFFLTAHKFSNS